MYKDRRRENLKAFSKICMAVLGIYLLMVWGILSFFGKNNISNPFAKMEKIPVYFSVIAKGKEYPALKYRWAQPPYPSEFSSLDITIDGKSSAHLKFIKREDFEVKEISEFEYEILIEIERIRWAKIEKELKTI